MPIETLAFGRVNKRLGFGGEGWVKGQARSIDFRTGREEPCPVREDRHTLSQREDPPHSRPLSRVGVRGAENCHVVRLKATRHKTFRVSRQQLIRIRCNVLLSITLW